MANDVNNNERIELLLPSSLGYEKVARIAVERMAEGLGFNDERVEDMKTAVAEAVMNAIEHGNREQKNALVTVKLNADHEHVEVKVSDEGLKQMPEEMPEPGRIGDDGLIRGLGLMFIMKLVDEVEFSQLPSGGNEVRMVIYLSKPSYSE